MTEDNLSRLHIDKTRQHPPSRTKRYMLLIIVIALPVAAGWLYHRGVIGPAVSVQTVTVQKMYPSQTITVLNASGYVVAQRKAAVASKITGRLIYLAVEEGSRVQKGDIIARLENNDSLAARDQAEAGLHTARFQLEQSRADLTEATLMYNRHKDLIAGGYIATSDFDATDARHKRAMASVQANEAAVRNREAALRAAEVTVDYANLRAPFDAVVLTKNADVGDIVTPLGAAANAKAAVVDVADMKSLKVEVDVSESNIEKVFLHQPCEIYLDALPAERFPGKVHIIVPTADRTKASVMVKVAFEALSPQVLPEMSAKVAFLSREIQESEKQPVMALPASAVLSRNNRSVVFGIVQDKAVEISITAGRELNGMIEMVTGVTIGDKIIAAPNGDIQNGTKVKLAQ